MSQLIGTDIVRVILGLGKTGHSMAAWLSEQGKAFRAMDTRESPPYAEAVAALCGDQGVHLGGWQKDWLAEATELYVSPGVPLADPQIQQAVQRGARVISDIDLYCQHSSAEIIAVTGSNGKSTVVTLLQAMAREAGIIAATGGNIGTPVLDLLKRNHDVAILELSSFQLEMTHALKADVAMVLNVSPDHMDRYPDMDAYRAAKHRIFDGCASAVVHADDPMTKPAIVDPMPYQYYSVTRRDADVLSITVDGDGVHFYAGLEHRHTWSALKIKGHHNLLNVLAALGAARLMGWSQHQVVKALAEFPGLPHRCQWVADAQGVTYINDSKGTNVGATLAALDGLAPECTGVLRLLAGGDGKSADFTPLARACERLGVRLYAYGRDGGAIANAAAAANVPVSTYADLQSALRDAHADAASGDWVILSPACASLDQFSNFEVRGDAFVQAVSELITDSGLAKEGAS